MKHNNTNIDEVEFKRLLNNIYGMTIQGAMCVLDQYICNILDNISGTMSNIDSMSEQEKCLIENICLFSVGLFIRAKKHDLVQKYMNIFKNVIVPEKFDLINKDFNVAKAYILSNLSSMSLDNEFNKKMLQLEKKYNVVDGILKAKAYIYCYDNNALEMVNLMDTIDIHKAIAKSTNNEERYKWLSMIFDELMEVYNRKFNTQYSVMLDELQMLNSEILI